MGSGKVQLFIWVKWKMQKQQVTQLDPEDLHIQESQEMIFCNVIVETTVNKTKMKIFQNRDVRELIQRMFVDMKMHGKPNITKEWLSTGYYLALRHQLSYCRFVSNEKNNLDPSC